VPINERESARDDMKAKKKAAKKNLKKGKKLSSTKTLRPGGGNELNPQPLPP
jgi:hypothetical protein